jgi:transglutaminase-like putative cysteine protease
MSKLEENSFRLPPVVVATALVSFAALFATEGGSIALPLLALALLASYATPYRLRQGMSEYGAALLVAGLLVFIGSAVRPAQETNGLFESARSGMFGELCAAILVVEIWRKQPSAGGHGVIVILLTGLVMFSAANTYDEKVMPVLVPLYALFLALSLRTFRAATDPAPIMGSHRNTRIGRAIALAAAILIGRGAYVAFYSNKTPLTDWGRRMLNEAVIPQEETTGISREPQLGSTYGLHGTLERVLRVEGNAHANHLRALSFSIYTWGRWDPPRDTRRFVAADLTRMRGGEDKKAETARVTRLANANGILFAPLNSVGLDIPADGDIQWAPDSAGPLRTNIPAPTSYSFRVNSDNTFQGPLCSPPAPLERRDLLTVPPMVDPRVVSLARQVAGQGSEGDRAKAIVSYLMSHHPYSLTYNPGRGDPVSNFVLGSRGAHCEYFASALAIMLRCIGIPARYVVGYYAHEEDTPGVVIVRQRDAHAWTEAWLDNVGWVTLDATPADGRPDEAGEKIPFWVRVKEWIQDRFASMTRAQMLKYTILFGVVALAALAVERWIKRRRTSAPPVPFVYQTGAEEIAALGSQFEALCLRNGIAFPSEATWMEALARAKQSKLEPGGIDVDLAVSFVEAYNRIRFGGLGAPADLRAILVELEAGVAGSTPAPAR